MESKPNSTQQSQVLENKSCQSQGECGCKQNGVCNCQNSEKSVCINDEDDDDDYQDLPDMPTCGGQGDPDSKLKAALQKQNEKVKEQKVVEQDLTFDMNEGMDLFSEIPTAVENEETKVSLKQPKKQVVLKHPCYKCSKAEAKYKFRNDFACESCFLEMVEHKFKSNFRIHCDMSRRKTAKLIIALSGGLGSISMLKMLHETIFNSQRKQLFSVVVLHIDETYVYPQKQREGIAQNIQKIKKFCQSLSFPLQVVPIESVYQNDGDQRLPLLLNSIKSSGSYREDVIDAFKRKVMIDFSTSKGIKHILLGTCGQRVAAQIFSHFVKGKGFNADNEVAFLDNIKTGPNPETDEVFLCRPMKDSLNQEVQLYCHIRKLFAYVQDIDQHISQQDPQNAKLPSFGNISHVMESFLDTLQSQFPTTIHSVMKTGDQIQKKFEPHQGVLERCPLCFEFRDQTVNILEIETFDQELQALSTQAMELDKQEDVIKAYLGGNKISQKDPRQLALCFACRRIIQNTQFSDQGSIFQRGFFPDYVAQQAELIVQQSKTENILLI